ncbi:MAG TPA: glycosyl hydrolase family 28-related protein [Candidatus Brocadiia bacterium]|nr:glycosyl hydrolase family 28-related protein [Candidatus Brocadiia bacterium]
MKATAGLVCAAFFCISVAAISSRAAEDAVVTSGNGDKAMNSVSLEGVHNAKNFGAAGDGKSDDTAAIQSAIDKAAEGGGRVYLPPGRYLVSGSLRVRTGVAVTGAAVAPQYITPLIGTVVLATGGRDDENAPALFELGDSSAVQGLTVHYPDQKPDDIHPYAWTFHLQGGDNTVENVTLINSYNAIRVGPEPNVRHRIRSVSGCALRRGVFVDNCTDIGRVENVQLHCHWWSAKEVGGNWEPVFEYMWKNLEAFVFGRTDWEYVTNNFVFPTNIGYRFIKTDKGECNGHFSGNGSDASQVCVQVDSIQPMGLLITNGQFVSFNGDNPTGLVVGPECNGQVRLVNCNFWGAFQSIAVLRGGSYVGFSDCWFSAWDKDKKGLPAIDAQDGRLQVGSCTFHHASATAVRVGKDVKHAIIKDNNGVGGVKVQDESGKCVMHDNE